MQEKGLYAFGESVVVVLRSLCVVGGKAIFVNDGCYYDYVDMVCFLGDFN